MRASGELWGKAPRLVAGNAGPRVKAYAGTLPDGETGYTFTTEVAPTRRRPHLGRMSYQWLEGAKGVEAVAGRTDFVKIAVKVMDA